MCVTCISLYRNRDHQGLLDGTDQLSSLMRTKSAGKKLNGRIPALISNMKTELLSFMDVNGANNIMELVLLR